MNKCPKCGYERQLGDTECPRCGIVYEKYEAYLAQKRAEEEARQQEAKRIVEEEAKKRIVDESQKGVESVRRVVTQRKKPYIAALIIAFSSLYLTYLYFISPYLDKRECRKAYLALEKIEAMLESGVSFGEYSKAVSDATFELNLIKKNSTISNKLKEILDYYQIAKEIWTADIENDYDAMQSLLKLVKKLFPELKNDADFRTYENVFDLMSSIPSAKKIYEQCKRFGMQTEFLNDMKKNQMKIYRISKTFRKSKQLLWANASQLLLLVEYD